MDGVTAGAIFGIAARLSADPSSFLKPSWSASDF